MLSLNVLSTVNSSLLIWSEHTKVLIDGLHTRSLDFSGMSPRIRDSLDRGIPPFNDIDYLAFTHGHPDHFSLDETEHYLSGHNVKALVLPPGSGEPDRTDDILVPLFASSCPPIRYIQPCTAPWEECSYQLGDFKVTYVHTPHIAAPSYPEHNYSILLEHQDMTVFIGGDLAFPAGKQLEYLQDKHIDYCFMIPFYIMHRTGRKVLEALDSRMTYIYHIPYSRDDNQVFLNHVKRSAVSYGSQYPPIRLLMPDSPAFSVSVG
ncbi:MAG: MBL fold metallo-hydrolase [Lachnospiraceae bacterium]|nr:MBL fold metallo-hydrolase [Lachnospiraceae bacterium]MBR3642912.1 MBL fold metallo-hydrolase [Parasporobacterium sp.]